MLQFYARFEICDQTGEALSDHDMTEIHYNHITALQVILQWLCFVISLYVLCNCNATGTIYMLSVGYLCGKLYCFSLGSFNSQLL